MDNTEFDFFAYFMRMKYIFRWSLMRNTERENLSTHCADVAAIAHALALIGDRYFGKKRDAAAVGMAGLFHDMTETITGDMPTPVKYSTPELRQTYAAAEKCAMDRLLGDLPPELREEYSLLMEPGDPDTLRLVKAADKISALIKCIEEGVAGNGEFTGAEANIRRAIEEMDCPEADYFILHFMPSCAKTLDLLK